MAAVHTEQAVQLFPTAPGSKARRLQTGSEAADPGPQLLGVGERRHLRVTRSGSRVDPPAPPLESLPGPFRALSLLQTHSSGSTLHFARSGPCIW